MYLIWFLFACTGLVYLYFTKSYSYWKKRGIASPDGVVPGFGHMWRTMTLRENSSVTIKKIYEKYKDLSMVGFYDMTRPILMLREPELAKTVLQTQFSNFHENKFKVDPVLDPLLAKNPFFCYGEQWSAGRKRLTYVFSSSKLKVLCNAVELVGGKLNSYLDERIKKSANDEFDLMDLCTKYTCEVVANAGIGIESFSFDKDNRDCHFLKIIKQVFEPSTARGLVQMFTLFFPTITKILKIPFLTPEADEFFRTAVKQMLELRREEKNSRNDFFQFMMEMEKTKGNDVIIDEEALAAHLLSLAVDGTITSGITMSYACHWIARHPDIQIKLQKEIDTVLSRYNDSCNYEALKEMTYLDRIINETLRLNPPVGFLMKLCTQEYEIRGSDGVSCIVEPGTEIVIPILPFQMDQKYWEKPNRFDPGRFDDERKGSIVKFSYLPFGEGPRICPGMRMAFLEVKSGLVAILRNYSIEPSSKTEMPLKINPQSFLYVPVGGLWVHMKKR